MKVEGEIGVDRRGKVGVTYQKGRGAMVVGKKRRDGGGGLAVVGIGCFVFYFFIFFIKLPTIVGSFLCLDVREKYSI